MSYDMSHIHQYCSMYPGTANKRYKVGRSDTEWKDFNELPSLGCIKVFFCLALLRSGSHDVVNFK